MTGLARVLDAMQRQGVDVLLLGREPNARFVSGAARLFLAGERAFAPGCVVVGATGAVHLLAVGDAGMPSHVPRTNLYPISWNPGSLMAEIARMPSVAMARRIGVDGLTPLFERLIEASFPAADLIDGEALMRAVRRVKSDDEIATIRGAVVVAEAAMQAARGRARAGASEPEVVAAAMEAMARARVTTASFEPRVRRVNGMTAIDVGVLLDGCEGGVARTEPGSEQPAEQRDAIARCVVGTRAAEVAPTGSVHGIGFGYEVLESEAKCEAGMVLSVATGVVRDLVLVSDGAPDVLTTAPYA
jgi:Xaa-Pro dipeptidase